MESLKVKRRNLCTLRAQFGFHCFVDPLSPTGCYENLRPLYTEYNVGSYARTFQLSSKIEQDGISAALKDGVMTLVLPKVERAKPRKIAVS